MTGFATRGCIVCGTTSGLEQNHLAARANEATLTVPMCKVCHRVFTDWQWRLGILRNETAEERAGHDDIERAWALLEGFVLTACLGRPAAESGTAVTLGRAAGTLLSAVARAIGDDPRWGPKPGMRKGSGEPAPGPRGTIDMADMLHLALAVLAGLGAADPRLAGVDQRAETIARHAAVLDQRGVLTCGPELDAATARVKSTLARVGAIASLNDIMAMGHELQELAAFADQMIGLLAALAGSDATRDAVSAVEVCFGPPR